MVSNVKP